MFGHFHRNKLKEKPIYLNTSLNWNTEYFGDTFVDDYIGYVIHALLDSREWSFQDIINIQKIHAEVRVWHQYNEEV
jgi:hypothetical protein